MERRAYRTSMDRTKAGILLTGIIAIFFAGAFIQLAGCATGNGNQVQKPHAETARIEKSWGIKIESTRLSAAGYMIDFRYRVIDPEKAASLFDRQTKPILIDLASGAKMAVPNPPKVGPLRTSSKPIAGRSYFILFANPGRFIKAGNKVAVEIGDFKTNPLIVE